MKSTTKQPTTRKATKNRITALLLALLLVTTILSPQIPVKAQETTVESADISENNSSGGTSAGVGDNLPVDSFGEGYNKVISPVFTVLDKDGNVLSTYKYRIGFKGEGNLVVHSYRIYSHDSDYNEIGIMILSNKPMEYKSYQDIYSGSTDFLRTDVTENGLVSTTGENGIYYLRNLNLCLTSNKVRFSGLPNLHEFSDFTFYDNWRNQFLPTVDLSKDDYKSDEDKASMTPVRDESIGYLPRARYFDDRQKHSGSGVVNRIDVTSTIQWESFQESYIDYDNPYYIEIYAKLHYTTGHKKESNPSVWETDTPSMKMYQYKKFGEIKYTSERFEFPLLEPLDNYLQTLDVTQDASGNTINSKSDVNIFPGTCYVSDYYVRLLHYDYEKQQILCGGWTKLTLNDNGGSTSSEGDFTDNDPDGDWKDDPDGESDKDWDNEGDEKDPNNPDDPDNPDFGIDTSDIGKFIISLITSFLNSIKSILILVGEFPSLCGYVFSFLPNDIGTLMFCGTAAIIFMRFLGR